MLNSSWGISGREYWAMGRIVLIFAAITLLISLMGFSHAVPTLPLTQATNGISAALRIDPYPPTQMEDANLQLTLHDENNQPITGAKVQVDLSKLDISMPPYFLQASDGGNGTYQAQGTFSMSGGWQIRVDVFVAGTHRLFTYYLDVD